MKKLSKLFKQIQRLRLSPSKKVVKVWEDLKKFFNESELNVGVHEREKYIKIIFGSDNEEIMSFVHYVEQDFLICRCTTTESYPVEITSDIFILATHFNNLLTYGKVVVNVQMKNIDYVVKNDINIPLLYPEKIYEIIRSHYSASEDIKFAYNRLIYEGEAPAIIIADLLNEQNKNSDK